MILLVLDIRHDPSKNDLIMYNYVLSKNIPFAVILNKADKIARTKVEKRIEEFKNILGISYSPIFAFSNVEKININEIWNLIKEHITND